ncbi:MAG: ribosome maturation factor RimM [Legionellaceae bacterium]|nr:ribosome maturation factor RimM [Legionellaceae bacterium]
MSVVTPGWVVVGKFGRPQGIKGSIRVISFTEPRDNILQYPDWFIQKQPASWESIKRSEERVTPQHMLVQVDGYPSREAVSQLTNVAIAVPKDMLPALDVGEFYWHELAGMRVIHESGTVLGIVDSLFATGSNDVMVVIDNNKKRLIPYLPDDVILEVNKSNREITVRWDLDF